MVLKIGFPNDSLVLFQPIFLLNKLYWEEHMYITTWHEIFQLDEYKNKQVLIKLRTSTLEDA